MSKITNLPKFRKGSEWRRWDLHIHSVYSGESSTILPIKKIFEEAIDKGIAVISITDHSNCDGLNEIWDVWDKEQYKNIPIKNQIDFLPGIEMRTSSGKHSVHTLAIFPKIIGEERVTKEFLQSEFLNQLEYTESKIKVAGDGDYKKGLLKICTSFDKLGEHTKKLGGLLFIHAGTKGNGIETEMAHTSDQAEDHELLNSLGTDKEKIMKQWVNICELPNYEQVNLTERGFYFDKFHKPSVVFSDSHDSYSGEKYTWIKADPTFEGLKQIVYEPLERVRLQKENPFEDKKKIYFDSLKIFGSKNFIISDTEIPLNRELITVIGGRGSGKSALLESIAFLNEEHALQDQNGKPKIIEFYRKNMEAREPTPGFNFGMNLIDKDGASHPYTKTLSDNDNLGLPFLYIGQEKLSALATNDKELTQTICDLINLDFSELQKTSIVEKARALLANIKNTEAELLDLCQKYPDYKDGDFKEWIGKLIQKKEEQKQRLSSKSTKDLLDAISKATERGLRLKDFKQGMEELKQNLEVAEINKQIIEANKISKVLYPETDMSLPLVDLSVQKKTIEERVSSVGVDMDNLRLLIVEKRKALSVLGLKEDIGVLLQSAETIQREINNATKDKFIYSEKQSLLKKLVEERNGLFETIQSHLLENKKEVDDKFLKFKDSRNESTKEEKDLFGSVIQDVSIEGSVTFNQDVFCKYLLDNCFDRRIIRTIEDVKALIAKKNEKGVAKDITLELLKKWVENELDNFLLSESFNLKGRENLTGCLFTKWPQFLGIRAIVKLKGVPTEKLSVGQRGTLLLKIYLATATAKQIFIVDQPEDNLDNEFIMNELVPLINQIKKSRQVIISTHNANLVVNADAEQIIIACIEKTGGYISGSIENEFINEKIKEILEGGERAFRSRENKYGMGIV